MLKESSFLEVQARPELLEMVEEISESKGIDSDVVFKSMEAALKKVAVSKYGSLYDIRVSVDRASGAIVVKKVITVVEEVENKHMEISKSEVGEDISIGDEIEDILPSIDFDRSSVQPFRQILLRKIKEAEKEKEYALYIDKVGEIVSGYVKRVEMGNVYLELQHKAEGIIRRNKLIPREHIEVGSRVRALIQEVNQDLKNPQIILNRNSPEFVKGLFSQEINEVYEGLIEIKAVAREPGSRSKVAVVSKDTSLDPVSTCIGFRGARIQGVLEELKLEKIDLVRWSPDTVNFVINAFHPLEVVRILVDENKKFIEIVVKDEDLSLAVGRRGQNINLISKLVGWNINLMGEEKDREKRIEETKIKQDLFVKALDVDDIIAQLLVVEGFHSVEDLINEDKQDTLKAIPGFNEAIIEEIKSRAALFVENLDKNYKEKAKQLNVSDDLLSFEDLPNNVVLGLAENDIKSLKDFAELSVYDFYDIFPQSDLSRNQVEDLIMKSRKKVEI